MMRLLSLPSTYTFFPLVQVLVSRLCETTPCANVEPLGFVQQIFITFRVYRAIGSHREVCYSDHHPRIYRISGSLPKFPMISYLIEHDSRILEHISY